jgi:hypothetical protein
LTQAAQSVGLDIAVQRAGLHRRSKHLVVMDADSTLLQDEVIDLLAAECGCADEVARITEAAMNGDWTSLSRCGDASPCSPGCRLRSSLTCAPRCD